MQNLFPFSVSRLSWVVLALGVLGCKPEHDVPVPSAGRADFSRTVVLGGSELSGYQDGALYREGQEASIGNLVARQLHLASGGTFEQNLLPGNVSFGLNKAWVSAYRTQSRLGDRTDCEGVVSMGPVSDTVSEANLAAGGVWTVNVHAVDDYAIPNAGLWDLTRVGLGSQMDAVGAEPFARRYGFGVAGKSALGAAMEQDPSFFILWPGMQDVVTWASNGGYGSVLASGAVFRAKLDSVLLTLTDGGAKGVLATIPSIQTLPYFTTIPSRGLELSQTLADSLNNIYSLVGANVGFQAGENGFIVADAGTSTGYRQLYADEYITLNVPLDSMRCYYLGVLFKLMPDRYTLIRAELAALANTIEVYNEAIRALAAEYDLAVAEMADFYTHLQSGIRFDAVDFDTEFVSGGYFSLDGLWPHPKGSALAANEFIAAINAHYGATVPPVQTHTLRGVLFP